MDIYINTFKNTILLANRFQCHKRIFTYHFIKEDFNVL